jgi:hypothetical protein
LRSERLVNSRLAFLRCRSPLVAVRVEAAAAEEVLEQWRWRARPWGSWRSWRAGRARRRPSAGLPVTMPVRIPGIQKPILCSGLATMSSVDQSRKRWRFLRNAGRWPRRGWGLRAEALHFQYIPSFISNIHPLLYFQYIYLHQVCLPIYLFNISVKLVSNLFAQPADTSTLF